MPHIPKPLSDRRSSQPRLLGISLALTIAFCTASASAASKPHVITFGKWITVPWLSLGDSVTDEKPTTLKVRPLLVDSRVREFTLGPAHEVTDRLFVIRRVFRVNDSLPQEATIPPHWLWQRGGWLLVDRVTGRVSALNLPDFDASYSVVSWYRDYAAYCGVSDDGKQIYAVVAEINRRKPVVKWLTGEAKFSAETQQAQMPDSACRLPDWQRSPARVTFEANPSTKRTYVIRGHSVDLSTAEEDDEEAAK
jgi:hypothetical protein